MIWYDMIWYDMIQYDWTWCNMIWYDVTLFDVISKYDFSRSDDITSSYLIRYDWVRHGITKKDEISYKIAVTDSTIDLGANLMNRSRAVNWFGLSH